MLLRFEADQEYQIEAVNAVCDLFEGQPRTEADITSSGGGFPAIPNRLDIVDERLLAKLRQVQERGDIEPDEKLRPLNGEVKTADGTATVGFANFTVEAETGTGKTYIYIRTALELHRRYGLCKFIIVVPSIAIREGVLKTFQVTRKHFRELFGNTPYHYSVYDSANPTQVANFARDDGVDFLVMTLAAFNKASNVIHSPSEPLQGETPIHLLQATRPILILDEPQNMESERSIAALANLAPLFALRYSATHRNPYNLVYRLTPYDAYRLGLVKRIEVAGTTLSDFNRPFIRVQAVQTAKNTVTAKLAVHRLSKDGTGKESDITVRPGDDLRAKTNLPHYDGLVVEEIHPALQTVRFASGLTLGVGQDSGGDRETLFKEQIAYTVRQHAAKQKRLADRGIKVISLFFIDKVDNYVGEDAVIRRLFDEAFMAQRHTLDSWQGLEPEAVQAAYFAQRRTKAGEVILEDSKSGETQKDQDAYDLIMRDKERLLSFEDPHCFIFSHSALREGWDNPNVFQICTLHQTASEMKKRQEIGRGVRLAVNQQGERVREPEANVLTVVANESYEDYVRHLQDEVEQEFGRRDAMHKPPRAGRVTVHPRKEYRLREEFRELWERIKHKTRYCVHIDTERLVADVVHELDRQTISAPRVRIDTGMVQVGELGFEAVQIGTRSAAAATEVHSPLQVLRAMEHLMLQTSPPMRLTRQTLVEVFRRTRNREAGLRNPQEFAAVATGIIKRHLADQLVRGIEYEKIGEWYEMDLLEEDFESWREHLQPAGKSYYDQVVCESGPESDFVRDLESREDIILYVKLPHWFTVTTPIGEYNPDWAIVMRSPEADGEPLLYLVRETKSTTVLDRLHPDERRRIECARSHFCDALGMGSEGYRVVTAASELP